MSLMKFNSKPQRMMLEDMNMIEYSGRRKHMSTLTQPIEGYKKEKFYNDPYSSTAIPEPQYLVLTLKKKIFQQTNNRQLIYRFEMLISIEICHQTESPYEFDF